MSSRYQKILPQLTPSTSVLDTRSTTPDVTPALQFAQQLQTNLDELSVIKTPNHLAGDAEFVKRGYLDPINEAKNKAIESFKNNNIAEGVQGLRDIKSFMLQSQQQGGVYSQIENNYNKAAEYTKQLEEGYNKGTYQDWQVNSYKGLINKSKSFNDKGEYVPFELSNPAQALDLPKYFNDLAKDWGKTSFKNYKLTSDGLFYDMSSGSRVTKEEVKEGLLKFMASDTKAQSYYKELASVFGQATADSMFNNAMNAAADKEEFNEIHPHYVKNPLLESLSDGSRGRNGNDKKNPFEGLLPYTVSGVSGDVDVSNIPTSLYLTKDGDLITPMKGLSGDYISLNKKEKVNEIKKGVNIPAGGTYIPQGVPSDMIVTEKFKQYPARNDYQAVTLDQILSDDKFKKVKDDLTKNYKGLLDIVRRHSVEDYQNNLNKKADYKSEDYNKFIFQKYNELNKEKKLFANVKPPVTGDNDELLVTRPNGSTIKETSFKSSELPRLITAFGTNVVKIGKDGKAIPITTKELGILKTKDFTKSIVVGSFQNEGFNPHAGKYLISLDGVDYVIPADTVAIGKNGNLSNVALFNLFNNNGQSSKLGYPVGTVGDFTDSEYLYTKIFLEGNNPANVPPLGGEFIVSMDDKYDKNNKIKDFNYDNYNPDNSDIKITYKTADGKRYPVPQNIYSLADLTTLARDNYNKLNDTNSRNIYINYLQQLQEQQK
jgi:hypothetical protein